LGDVKKLISPVAELAWRANKPWWISKQRLHKAAGAGVLTNPRRPGTVPALGLRAGTAALAYRGPLAEGRANMMACDYPRSNRVKGFLNFYWTWSLCCALLVVLVLACHLCRLGSDKRLDTRDWQMTDFLEHLQKRGLHFHVVPEVEHGSVSQGVYLTEDPGATWASMQCKAKIDAYIHEWRGTVWVGRPSCWKDREGLLVQWGECACQIGNFILFGDKELLRRIQEACR
jgi:hypothetical protein